jgi:DNA-binding transcriptional LysR family regulator
VELRHLHSFLAVAEELHFGRAAARLHISQPPLSQRIRRLEDELGARLFRRTKRRVELTPAGQAFLTEARQTLAQAERTVRAAQRAARGEVGELGVGYVPFATYGPPPDVVRVSRKRFPGVDLRLQNLRSVQQRQALIDRKIDVGFVRPQVTDPRVSYEAIWREAVIVALPDGHPLTRRTIVNVSDLAAEPFVVVAPEEPASFYDPVLTLCRKAGFTARVAHRVPDVQAAIALVAAGLGIGPVPAAVQGFKRKGVVYRPLRPLTLRTEMGLAWRRDDDSPIVEQFRQVAREIARPPSTDIHRRG